jgi:hypothetical protein
VARRVVPEEQSDRIEKLEQRIDQLEWRRRASERSRAFMDSVVPEETRDHLRAAGREQLLAVRSLIDHWIGRLERRPTDGRGGREDIPID